MKQFTQIKECLEPYMGIIRFMLAMFIANIIWKISLVGDMDEVGTVLLFGSIDVTGFFGFFTQLVSDAVYFVLHNLLGMNIQTRDFILKFETGEAIRIVWGCSGLKQMFIFTVIMLFSYGSWKHKLWFIPLGILICFCVNIVRIILLSLIAYDYPAQLDLFHSYIFKYVFYGIIFLIWLVWNEKYGYEKCDN